MICPPAMFREADFLQQLVERPFDRELRLVYADWLQEQGDPRGEVIALFERGSLSLSERRRVARITAMHGRGWLGPLHELADPHRTRFIGGFIEELACRTSRPATAWASLIGEPRLATVRSLVLPPGPQALPLAAFLSSPVMRSISRLELGSDDWAALRSLTSLQLARAVVASWGVFRRELSVLAGVPAFQRASVLGLSSTEFINAIVVREIVHYLREQHAALGHFEEVQLLCRYGVLEGAAAWLLAVESATADALPATERWTVEVSEVAFTRARGDGGFHSLKIDLSLPESNTGEKEATDSVSSFERRLATAAGVLVQLAPARLRSVRVVLAPGARLRHTERDALKAAARRSGLLESFVIDGDQVSP